MKIRHVFLLIAATVLLAGSVQAEEAGEAAAEAPAAQEAAAADGLSSDWKDYQIQLDGEIYSFPMTYGDFTARGWAADDGDEDGELEPNQYDTIRFQKEDIECEIYVLNLAVNNLPLTECLAAGISIDTNDWAPEDGEVVLPGGLVRGQADTEAIKTAYGEPSDTYESERYTKLTYDTDSNCEISLYVYKESGVLDEIDMRNFVEPEGFDPGEPSDRVPERVTAYAKPEALSGSLDDFQMEIAGEIYAFPVPVSTLIADGWELDTDNSDDFIKAGYFGWVTLRRDGQELSEVAVNPEAYAALTENCWIEGVDAGGYFLDVTASVPCGISLGMSEDDFVAALENAGVPYEVTNESDDFKYYVFNEIAYDRNYEAVIYLGDAGHFEQGTVMELSCSNAF